MATRALKEEAKCGAPQVGLSRRGGSSSTMLNIVLKSLSDAKAEDVVSIDLEGKTAIADFMIVASGRSNRHVSAIADQILDKLKQEGFRGAAAEGLSHGDWVLIDGGDVVIHIFRPEVREFYNLEKMWLADRPAEPSEPMAI